MKVNQQQNHTGYACDDGRAHKTKPTVLIAFKFCMTRTLIISPESGSPRVALWVTEEYLKLAERDTNNRNVLILMYLLLAQN